MPKLYYTPHSCGASNFISAWVGKVNIECEQVNLENHTTASGLDFYTINPKGNVPCLVFEDGMILNENGAVLQWIGDHVPAMSGLSICPPNGTYDRYLLQNCLNYLSSEVHQSFGPLFSKQPSEIKHFLVERANSKLTYLEKHVIADREFLIGDTPTIADFYCYVLLSWHPILGLDLTQFPKTKLWWQKMDNLAFIKSAKERMATNPSTVLDSSSTTTTFGEKVSAMNTKIVETLKPTAEKVSETMGKVTDKLTGTETKPMTDAENRPPINN